MIRKTEKTPTNNSATTTPTIAATAEFLLLFSEGVAEGVTEVGKVELVTVGTSAVEDTLPVMIVKKNLQIRLCFSWYYTWFNTHDIITGGQPL